MALSASLTLALGITLAAAAPAAAAGSPVTTPAGIEAEVGASSVILTWEPSTSQEGEVTHYQVQVGSRYFFPAEPALTVFLARDTTYRVLVTAFDSSSHHSDPSEPFFFTTSEDFPVTTPGNVQVGTSPGTVTVEWDASSSDAGVMHYLVALDPGVLGTMWGRRTADTSTTFTFPAGGTFEVTVRAVDEAWRYSDRSEPVDVTVEPALDYLPPTPPENFQVQFEDGRAERASWDASQGTGPIFYHLQIAGQAVDRTAATEMELFDFSDCSVPGTSPPFELTVVAAAHGVTSPPSNPVLACFG